MTRLRKLIISSLGAVVIIAGGLLIVTIVVMGLYPISEEASGFYLGTAVGVPSILAFLAGYSFCKWQE